MRRFPFLLAGFGLLLAACRDSPTSLSLDSQFIHNGKNHPGKGPGNEDGDGDGSAALSFDGADDGTRTPDSDLLDLTDTFTIEGWIKPTSPAGLGAQGLFAKWGLSPSASYGGGFENDGRVHLVTHDPAQNPDNTKIFSSGPLAVGVWQHFAFVFDHGQAWLYINGALNSSCGGSLGNCWNGNTGTKTVASMNTPQVTTSRLSLGREDSPEGFIGSFYSGLMDEVRIWNVTRSQKQIARDMNKEISAKKRGLVAYWRMDEGSGQIAADATANGHHMQLGTTAGVESSDPTWVTPGKL